MGAGTGADLPFIPATVQITAVDITQVMLQRLRQRATSLGMTVDVQVMDGQALEFSSEQFDAVILHLILAVIPDPIACIREVERVLKPGGRAAETTIAGVPYQTVILRKPTIIDPQPYHGL